MLLKKKIANQVTLCTPKLCHDSSLDLMLLEKPLLSIKTDLLMQERRVIELYMHCRHTHLSLVKLEKDRP